MKYYRRLPLEGLMNARELGGFPVLGGGATRYGVFIRSEVTKGLTEADKAFLRDYGVKMDIDLRSAQERDLSPDPLEGEDWLEYAAIPIYDDLVARGADGAIRTLKKISDDFTWGNHYVLMAEDYKPWVKLTLEKIAECRGAALYHCTTGKDRTGIITALLLSICAVPEEDIVADYSVSQVFLQRMYRSMSHLIPSNEPLPDLSSPFFCTSPKNMETLLEHINAKYGGILPYLEDCGMSAMCVESLKARLLDSD